MKNKTYQFIKSSPPTIALLFVVLAVGAIFSSNSGPVSVSSVTMALESVVKYPERYYEPKSYYAETFPELKSAGIFLAENVPEGSRVLFMSNTEHELEFFSYFVIEFFSDKRIKYFFDFHIPTDEEVVVNNMKNNQIEYLFVFQGKVDAFSGASDLLGKTFLLKLEGDRLVVEAVHE